jgi:hypothetical protein
MILFLGLLKGWDERDRFTPNGMMHKIKNKLNSKNFLSLKISNFSFEFHAKNWLVVPASLVFIKI